jgi:C6 transcription factor Pro1
MANFLTRQYLLIDPKDRNLIFDNLQSSPTARDAACMLSSLHRRLNTHNMEDSDPESALQVSSLRHSLVGKAHLTEDEAMAGLHVVSWVLFNGGVGQWEDFLHVAFRYADSVLWHPDYHGPQDALMRCRPITRFIIKTAMWFDVLASATRSEAPNFLDVFRGLFDPNNAFTAASPSSVPEELSMLPIMGCENHIVWALAEISNLASWKDLQKERGALSMPDLINRGAKIEKHIMPPISPLIFYDAQDQMRLLTSQIFRASARVYLHSVLSGDYPSCKEIAEGVTDTIEWLKRVPEHDQDPSIRPLSGHKDIARSVVRSVVFSICICGCLTDIPWQRDFFLSELDKHGKSMGDKSMGNCRAVKALIQKVWRNRETSSSQSLTWREVVRESRVLLV